MSVWRHVRAVGLLPGAVTLGVPAIIVWRADAVHVGWGLRAGLGLLPALLGGALIGLGLLLLASTILLFAAVGQGTLAPWDPTSRLVVGGPYRHLRHPMISGVLCILLGEAALFGSPVLGDARPGRPVSARRLRPAARA